MYLNLIIFENISKVLIIDSRIECSSYSSRIHISEQRYNHESPPLSAYGNSHPLPFSCRNFLESNEAVQEIFVDKLQFGSHKKLSSTIWSHVFTV